jgi:hypothetical protein
VLGDSRQKGRAHQQLAGRCRQSIEDLACEVAEHRLPGFRRQRRPHRIGVLQALQHQDETRCPAVRLTLQQFDSRGIE